MSVVVGSLVIDLKANTASFSQSMDRMSQLSAKSANDIKRSLEKITAAGIAMAAAIATGTAAAIKGALDAADELGKMAQAAGTTAETLSTLEYAGKLANVQNETLVKGLEKLSLAAFKAQGGNVQLERIFSRVGVTVRDSNGALKDSGILMEEIAVKFAKMGDSAGKTALAQAIFGKAGAGLIPFLNQYGSEQEKVNDEAHRFGLVLSTSTVEVAAHAHDSLEKLSSIMKGLGFSLLSATLPALDELLNKLINISQSADLQDLAKSFGGEVVKAVHALGDSLDFAAEHATALKHAMEALVALKVAAIAIPVLGDLQKGGAANVGKGLDKFTVGFLGLEKVLPVLKQFGTRAADSAKFVGLLASEEGIASAASYVLGGAVSAMGGPIGIAIAAIVGIGIALYKFRDATFSVGGSTYELRDTWNAAWLAMKDVVGVAVDFIEKRFNDIKVAWTGAVNWIKDNPLFTAIETLSPLDSSEAIAKWIKSKLGLPDIAKKYLDEAKAQRLGLGQKSPTETAAAKALPKLPPPDTSGLGKAQKDIFGDEIRKLDLAVEAQQKYLSVIDGTPEAIQAATAAEKAHAVIVELNNRLTDEGRANLTGHQQAMIQDRVALEESLKSLVDYGKEIVNQQHSTDLSIQQARVLTLANAQGDQAVRQATIDNAILGLTYNKTAEQIAKMAPELVKLRGLLTIKANTDLAESAARDIFSINQETASQRILHDAIMGTIDAQRQAEIESRTYAISQQIAAASDNSARAALMEKRDAMIEQMRAQQEAADLAEARSTLSGPADQYQRDVENLNNLVDALKKAQGGTLTYFQQLELAAHEQDAFNKATDHTVELLLREGSVSDGITAFFLKMQEQAKTAAESIFQVLNETFNKLGDNLTNLITAPNRWKRQEVLNQFGSMFGDIGKNLLDTTIKSQMQSGLGALGKAFHIPGLGALGGKPDGTQNNPLWVRSANESPAGGPASGIVGGLLGGGASAGTPSSGSGILGGLGSVFGGLFGASSKATSVPGSPQAGGSFLGHVFSALTNAGKASPQLSTVRPTFPTGIMAHPNELQDLGASTAALMPTEGTSPLGAPSENNQIIPSPKDEQRRTITEITRPQPSLLDKILGAAIQIGGQALGAYAGGATGSLAQGQGDDGGFLAGGMGFATGGKVSGAGSGTSDSIPAMLSHGEFVTKASQTAKHLPLLQHINNDTLKFAMGGLVGYDDGGYVSPSMAYVAGERGTGMMTDASTRIAGNASSSAVSRSAGDTHHWSIDARGSNDPAQTTAHLDRYMRTAGPQIAAAAVHAMKDQQLRRPPSAR